MATPRERLIAAAIAIVAEESYGAATIAGIVARAGTAREDFTVNFASIDDCCGCALAAVCDEFDRHLLPIYLRPEPWRSRIRAAALTAARYCRRHETEVTFAIAEQFRRRHFEPSERSLRLHLEQVDAARLELSDPAGIPAMAAEFALGSFLELVIKSHAEDSLATLEAAVPGLLYKINELYFGSDVAAEELIFGEQKRF